MQNDIRNIIFWIILILIFIFLIYLMASLNRTYPVDYTKRTYSYKRDFKLALKGAFVSLAVALLVYFFSGSFDIAVSIGGSLLGILLAAIVWDLLAIQRWAKIRGARKED
jgi:hypothetical protein